MAGWIAVVVGPAVGILTFVLLVRWVVRRATRGRASLGLPGAKRGDNCQKCLHWHHAEGQRVMRENEAFFQASQHLSINTMAKSSLDSDGQPNKNRKPLPQMEDKWFLLGACLGHEQLRHRTDVCEGYEHWIWGMLLAHTPGEGEFPLPSASTPHPETVEPPEPPELHAVSGGTTVLKVD